MMNALIGEAKPLGPAAMPEGMEGHLWAERDRKLLIAWTEDGSSRRLDIPGAKAWDVYGGALDEPIVAYLPTFVEFAGDVPELTAEPVERITADLLEPETDGQPYRARFTVQVDGPVSGEWTASGPYFLQRERTETFPADIGADATAELVLTLNVWPNLPVSGREVEVRLYMPGRVLSGTLAINTAASPGT
jgi:hypothetical protein